MRLNHFYFHSIFLICNILFYTKINVDYADHISNESIIAVFKSLERMFFDK